MHQCAQFPFKVKVKLQHAIFVYFPMHPFQCFLTHLHDAWEGVRLVRKSEKIFTILNFLIKYFIFIFL